MRHPPPPSTSTVASLTLALIPALTFTFTLTLTLTPTLTLTLTLTLALTLTLPPTPTLTLYQRRDQHRHSHRRGQRRIAHLAPGRAAHALPLEARLPLLPPVVRTRGPSSPTRGPGTRGRGPNRPPANGAVKAPPSPRTLDSSSKPYCCRGVLVLGNISQRVACSMRRVF